MKKKTIRVRLGDRFGKDGRMPLPRDIIVDSNVSVLTPETDPVEVVLDRYIRRRISQGDLVEVRVGSGIPTVNLGTPAKREG